MSCNPRNAKFIGHFESMRQEATRCNNSSLSRNYATIIASLQRYPLTISAADQAECLHGVGPVHLQSFQTVLSRCNSIEDEIDESSWLSLLRRRVEEFSHQTGGLPRALGAANHPPTKKARRLGIGRPYFPPIGSSKWAAMVVLHSRDEAGTVGIPIAELKRAIENMHSKYPKTTKFGDSVIKKMVIDGVVDMVDLDHSPDHPVGIFGYSGKRPGLKLTEKGIDAGNVIWTKSLQTEDLSTLLGLNEFDTNRPSMREYELVLIVDNREFAISNILESANLMNSNHFRVELRTLTVSDFLWVWRKRTGLGDEYIAGYAVERKTIEDLSTSIKDGRYEEQKSRLAKAPGLNRIVYIVEGSYEETAQSSLSLVSEQAIQTSIRHTEMTQGFSVIETKNIQDTANALIEMHARIESVGFLRSDDDTIDMNDLVSFRDFTSGSQKSNRLTVAQMTARMLRVIPGIGAEAIASLNEYLDKTGKGGLTIANVAELVKDPALNTAIKDTLGLKRIPLSATALSALREQYTTQLN